MKAIRRQMMGGVLPRTCEGCAVPTKTEVYRLSFNRRFKHHLDDIRKSTHADGSTSSRIVSVDYRAHTCNLKCRTCGPWSSSAWLGYRNEDERKLRTIVFGADLSDLEKSLRMSPYKREFLDVVRNHPIEEMYFAGGEPLMSAEHYRVLDYLIESGRCRAIQLNYNTNLSLDQTQVEKLLSRVRHFKSTCIACSIDGSREVSEYIRAGLNFEQFESNLKTLIAARAECPGLTILLDPTLTSLLLLDLKEFCEFALTYSLPVTAKLMKGNEVAAGYLRCEFLPQPIRVRLIDEWRVYYACLPEHSKALLTSFKDNLELAERVASIPVGHMRSCAAQAVLADTGFGSIVRFEDFLRRDDGVYSWWKSLEESASVPTARARAKPDFRDFSVESMTDDRFSMLEDFLKSFHDFFHQYLLVLYCLQNRHTDNAVSKSLLPNCRLTKTDLVKWRLDPEHGLLHGLTTAYFAVKLASGWRIPTLLENVDVQRLMASCLVHDYARVAKGQELHDQELRTYFALLLPETYSHSNPPDAVPLVQADRLELLRYEDKSWIDLDRIFDPLPHEAAYFEVWAFYRFIRPALARLFQGRTDMWLRHGAEETEARKKFPNEPMVSRSKEVWPHYYYRWPGFPPEYWAVEVGELARSHNKPHLVDCFFPSGLMTIDEYRACAGQPSIVPADGREHEIAYGEIPLQKWIFVFEDHRLNLERQVVAGSGGFVTFPILTNIIDVADALYAKLYAVG